MMRSPAIVRLRCWKYRTLAKATSSEKIRQRMRGRRSGTVTASAAALITMNSSSPAVKADALVVVKHDIRPLVVRVDRNQSVTLTPHRRHAVQGILSREHVE